MNADDAANIAPIDPHRLRRLGHWMAFRCRPISAQSAILRLDFQFGSFHGQVGYRVALPAAHPAQRLAKGRLTPAGEAATRGGVKRAQFVARLIPDSAEKR